jgi:hypothetical protein
VAATCSQCDKPALYQSGGHLFCLACYTKVEQIRQNEIASNMAMINYLGNHMEYSVFGGTPPRLEIPQPSVNVGPATFHNIHVDHSVIGAINTGEVQKLDVALSNIRNGGDEELHGVLTRLTEAIVNDMSFQTSAKNEALEHLSFLAEQAKLPKDNRKSATARIVFAGLERLLSVSANLAQLLSVAQPHLEKLFC